MRIRKKPWAENEFEINKNFVHNPLSFKGKWRELFRNDNPIHIEIGCGKGQFITSMAMRYPDINFVAVERQSMIIAAALKKAREKGVGDNVVFFSADANDLRSFFEPSEAERIYINFCDPWPNKNKWAKRRLTHKNFLAIYEYVFGGKGEIWFKTDNSVLFEFSLNEFEQRPGWKMKNISLDLHNSNFDNNVMTEYEEKFSQKGMPIFRLEAVYTNDSSSLVR